MLHHGDVLKNWRELEQYVERDDAGHIISRPDREGTFFICAIPKLKWVQYRKQHGKAHTGKFTDVEMAIKAVSTIKKAV
jgi:hypothetical protein